MDVELGLVGLPQSGKSSLLALLCGGPPSGRVAVALVPDPRLDTLAAMLHPRKVTPAHLQLTELAGLVPGRLERGARNAFFEGVRRTDALLHVVRAFQDPALPHPSGGVDPLRDARSMEEELLLADLERVDAVAERLRKNRARSREEDLQLGVLDRCAQALGDAIPVRRVGLNDDDLRLLTGFGLLTARSALMALNVGEAELRDATDRWPELWAWAREVGMWIVPCSARVEAEIGGDTFFPPIRLDDWKPILVRRGPPQTLPHTYWVYRRKRPDPPWDGPPAKRDPT